MTFKKDKLALFFREYENILIGISPTGHLFRFLRCDVPDCVRPCYSPLDIRFHHEMTMKQIDLFGTCAKYPTAKEAYKAMIDFDSDVEFVGFL